MTTTSLALSANRRAALIVGHPGHELRVWGWMHTVQPTVAVLTDGGGRTNTSRLDLSEELCNSAGATISPCFGLATDAEMYRAILGQDFGFFLALADKLAGLIVDSNIDYVVADAAEGYNPTHDVCRLVTNRAVRLARRHRAIDCYAFLLTGSPVVESPHSDWLCVRLDAEALEQKVRAARAYAAIAGGLLPGEIEALIERYGTNAFACEYLQPIEPEHDDLDQDTPFYETHGERQVAAGHYSDVIRLGTHMMPIAQTLRT